MAQSYRHIPVPDDSVLDDLASAYRLPLQHYKSFEKIHAALQAFGELLWGIDRRKAKLTEPARAQGLLRMRDGKLVGEETGLVTRGVSEGYYRTLALARIQAVQLKLVKLDLDCGADLGAIFAEAIYVADQRPVCFCQTDNHDAWTVRCANATCDVKAFHTRCVGVGNPADAYVAGWLCAACQRSSEEQSVGTSQ